MTAGDPTRFVEPLSLAGARLRLGRHVALFAVAAICGPLIAMALSRFRRGTDVSAEAAVFEALDPLGVKLAGDVAKVSACWRDPRRGRTPSAFLAQIGGVQQHALTTVDDAGALDREQEPFDWIEVHLGIRETGDGIGEGVNRFGLRHEAVVLGRRARPGGDAAGAVDGMLEVDRLGGVCRGGLVHDPPWAG